MNKKEVIKEYDITKKYIVFKKNGLPYEFNTEKECKQFLISKLISLGEYKIINLDKLKDDDEIKNIWIMKGITNE